MNLLDLFRHETDTVIFDAGQTILSPEHRSRVMYVLVEGEAQISVAGTMVETAVPGVLLNELALIGDAPGNATVVAATACRLVTIDERRFKFLVQQTPNFSLYVMQALAERLRAMNARLIPKPQGV
jgi:CRP/FNR family transcriptional regulator, cyclic AMP receptor protein